MIMAKNETTVAENHEYEKSNSINSVQSSLKSHPMRVTLYVKHFVDFLVLKVKDDTIILSKFCVIIEKNKIKMF